MADPRRHRARTQPSGRGSGFPRRSLDRFVPRHGVRAWSTFTRGLGSQRCGGHRGSRFHVERGRLRRARARHLRSRVRAVPRSRKRPARSTAGTPGPSMRLLAGTLAAAPFRTVLVGDPSLSSATDGTRGRAAPRDGRRRRHDGRARAARGGGRTVVRRRHHAAAPHRPGEERHPPGRHRGGGRDDRDRARRDARPHRAGARRPGRARVRRGTHGHAAGRLSARRVHRHRAGRRLLRGVPGGGGRADRLGADGPRGRAEPEPAALPARAGAHGGADRDAPDPARSWGSRSATCGWRRARTFGER